MRVDEIVRNGKDSAGAEIDDVYYRQPPHYAIYRTKQRVMVHFADADDEARQQDTALAPLNPLRGQINGLIDGWRDSTKNSSKARVKRYDRRVADALQVALALDTRGALDLLAGIKADITDERTSWARFAYLMVAAVLSVLLLLIIWCVSALWGPTGTAASLWTGLAGGAIGAFFSIAIAIRSRTVLTDLHLLDNSADAVLRVVIGAIAAGVLVAFVSLRAVTVSLGEGDFEAASDTWLFALALGFLAGFSERLIPDLLSKTAIGAAAAPAPPPAAPPPAPPQAGNGANQGAPDDVAQAHTATEDAHRLDDCLCDHAVGAAEATSDADLPPASGGIAAPQVPARATP
ncbi:MAG: hypothetical protein JO047_03665 [Alphaproteobacteria bacterium]|nr:hypothetical protein [Alphaproteobacteria bacterium]